jgi:hypothetical protein
MASSSSHSGIPLATLLEWYKIRDTFFVQNCTQLDIPLALELSESCQHLDAHWLTEACAGKDVTTREDAKRVFSALDQNDARTLCFLWLCSESDEQDDSTLLRRSAELGFAFAQALMAAWTEGEEKVKFAQLAAVQGERDGFYMLGACFLYGDGCEKNLEKAKENLVLASKLRHVLASDMLGEVLEVFDPQRWYSWAQAAALGYNWNFLANFSKQVEIFNAGSGSAAAVFVIGQSLQRHFIEEAGTIFKQSFEFDSPLFGPAKQAIAFYEFQIKATKDAICCWSLVGIKLNVVKDVRKLIAKLIWDSREEALFRK